MSTVKNFTIKNGVSVSGEVSSTNIDITKSFPTIAPTLSVDFAKTKTLASGITFTRNTTATYIGQDGLLKTAAVNEPRFEHDPVTLVSKGLLVEESRTNLLIYSDDFANVNWGKVNTGVTSNATTAPDGTTTADLLSISSTANVEHYIERVIGLGGANVTSNNSWFVKSNTQRYVSIRSYSYPTTGNNAYVEFDLLNGVVNLFGNTAGTTQTYSIQAYPNGWYRINQTVTFASSTDTQRYCRLAFSNGAAVTSYVGALTDSLYIWGAQAEVGDFPTSYIPTTSASVTRGVDYCWMDSSNMSWYNQSEGTFRASGYKNYQPTSFPWLFSANTLVANTDCVGAFYYAVAGVIEPLVRVGSTVQYNVWTEVWPINALNTISVSYKVNDFNVSVNGGALVPDTSGSVPTITGLRFGQGDNPWNGHIANLTYYPTRLTDSQVQNLSI
jgi:hypothetical protein